MGINDIKRLAVERIYLIPDTSEGQLSYAWCDDPAPSDGMVASEAVEYVRKDVHEAIIARQAKAAIRGMDASKAVGSSNMEHAKRLHAESSPDALESERAANALLTERIAQLEADCAAHKAAEETQIALRQKADEREQELAAHVEQLSYVIVDAKRCAAVLAFPSNYNASDYQSFAKAVMGNIETLSKQEPTNALDHRDKIKQAEAMEELYDQSALHKVINRGALINRARNLRHQAEAINEPPTKI